MNNMIFQFSCLFISLESIRFILISKIKAISNSLELDEQFININTASLSKSGFIVPCKYLDQTYICGGYKLIEWLNKNQEVANQIFEARHVDCEFMYIEDIRKIKQMYPHLVSDINFSFYGSDSTSISKI